MHDPTTNFRRRQILGSDEAIEEGARREFGKLIHCLREQLRNIRVAGGDADIEETRSASQVRFRLHVEQHEAWIGLETLGTQTVVHVDIEYYPRPDENLDWKWYYSSQAVGPAATTEQLCHHLANWLVTGNPPRPSWIPRS